MFVVGTALVQAEPPGQEKDKQASKPIEKGLSNCNTRGVILGPVFLMVGGCQSGGRWRCLDVCRSVCRVMGMGSWGAGIAVVLQNITEWSCWSDGESHRGVGKGAEMRSAGWQKKSKDRENDKKEWRQSGRNMMEVK